MAWYYILALIVDGIGILVALYFIFSDYIRYPNMASNGALSMLTMVFCGWVATSYYLYHHGHSTIASAMVWLPALPLIGYGLFVLMFLILKPDMK